MRTIIVLTALLCLFASTSLAQDSEDNFFLQVVVDSAFIRTAPSQEADALGSMFENESLFAVGRNIDGTWFEVRRPGREQNAGWARFDLFAFMFEAARLPITDLTTGVIGEEPVFDSGVSVFILTAAILRDRPSINATRIGTIPIRVTIPAVERSPDNQWLMVNYLGTTGWVAEFNTSTTDDISDLPVSDLFAGIPVAGLEIIPPAVQRAQAHRFIDYALPIRDTASQVADFWGQLADDQTILCLPPPGNIEALSVTQRDLFELPELRRATRRLPIALADLNASIAAMQRCGVYTPNEVSNHFAQAINARAILNADIDFMNRALETTIPAD